MGHIPVKTVKVADETIVLTDILSVGTQIYNVATKKSYVLTDINTDTDTLGFMISEGKATEIGVDGTGIPEAPIDGTQYGRQDEAWTPISSGGGGDVFDMVTMTSQEPDPGNPTLSLPTNINEYVYSGVNSGTYALPASLSKQAFFMSQDGIYIFMLLAYPSSSSIYQYTLSTPFDVSTIIDTKVAGGVTSDYGDGIYVKPDGTDIWICKGSNVEKSTMSTPWDVTTRSTFANAGSFRTNAAGITFTDDGSFVYVGGSSSSDYIWVWELPTPWSFSGKVRRTDMETTNYGMYGRRSISFSSDGLVMYGSDDGGKNIQIHLVTPWNLTGSEAALTFYMYAIPGDNTTLLRGGLIQQNDQVFGYCSDTNSITSQNSFFGFKAKSPAGIPVNPTEDNTIESKEGRLTTVSAADGVYQESFVSAKVFKSVLEGEPIDLSNTGGTYYNFGPNDTVINTPEYLYDFSNWRVGGRAIVLVSSTNSREPVPIAGVNVGSIKSFEAGKLYTMTVEYVGGGFRYWFDRVDITDPSASSVYGTLEEGDIVPLNNTKGAYYNIQTVVDLSTIIITNVAIGSRAMIKINQAVEPVIPPLPVPAVKLGAEVFIPNTAMMLTIEYNGDFVTYTYQILG